MGQSDSKPVKKERLDRGSVPGTIPSVPISSNSANSNNTARSFDESSGFESARARFVDE